MISFVLRNQTVQNAVQLEITLVEFVFVSQGGKDCINVS